jgi:hypothetical protein
MIVEACPQNEKATWFSDYAGNITTSLKDSLLDISDIWSSSGGGGLF